MSLARTLRLGTRGSPLARWQAEWIAAELANTGVQVELVSIATQGDTQRGGAIGSLGAQGVFTKEIQRVLLDGTIDLAVHSLKDLPTDVVEGLMLAAVPPRERPGDVLVSNTAKSLDELPEGARVGTGSLRRRAQLLHVRPDLQVQDIRGNVDTRLRKLDDGRYEAIVLAEAGLRRLGLDNRIGQSLSPRILLPAVGQGALGVEARENDAEVLEVLGRLDDAASRQAVLAERSLLAALRGGCLAPIGAWARPAETSAYGDAGLILTAVVLSSDGQARLEAAGEAPADEAETLGRRVADELVRQGARELIAQSREL
ncbi:MAG: hydroxymethylbilane synthase [Pirellulales bacterium]